jgi:hypothetical protein
MRLPLFFAAVLGASLLMLPAPAPAAQFGGLSNALPAQAQAVDGALVQQVRYRGRRHYHRGHRGGSDAGAVAAGAIIGIAIGAIIASQAAQHNRSVEWCMRRYRSYNPRTGTWVDYSGRIHYCP